MTPTTPRYFYRCMNCLSVTAVDGPILPRGTVCTACGGMVQAMGRVADQRLVRDEYRTPCDGRCTGARGPVCSCQCYGRNHGSNLLVTVTVTVGGIPTVTPVDAPAAILRAQEYSAAVGAAEQRVQTRWGSLFEAKRRGEWITAWSDYLAGDRARGALRAARALRTHAGRLRALAAVAGEG